MMRMGTSYVGRRFTLRKPRTIDRKAVVFAHHGARSTDVHAETKCGAKLRPFGLASRANTAHAQQHRTPANNSLPSGITDEEPPQEFPRHHTPPPGTPHTAHTTSYARYAAPVR